ncbi:hypothetical protein BKA70DRAFT_1222303 [Coprinopsis sp. MPI-PUGE-AT-0042]|nr:hypothetical protein BKA70DRAFT_1222303 [Coprinopsis sp. MPI-PUGE-AT-0042]
MSSSGCIVRALIGMRPVMGTCPRRRLLAARRRGGVHVENAMKRMGCPSRYRRIGQRAQVGSLLGLQEVWRRLWRDARRSRGKPRGRLAKRARLKQRSEERSQGAMVSISRQSDSQFEADKQERKKLISTTASLAKRFAASSTFLLLNASVPVSYPHKVLEFFRGASFQSLIIEMYKARIHSMEEAVAALRKQHFESWKDRQRTPYSLSVLSPAICIYGDFNMLLTYTWDWDSRPFARSTFGRWGLDSQAGQNGRQVKAGPVSLVKLPPTWVTAEIASPSPSDLRYLRRDVLKGTPFQAVAMRTFMNIHLLRIYEDHSSHG